MCKKILSYFIIIFFLIVKSAFATDTAIKHLENGFKVLLQKLDTAPLIAMQLWIPFGSTSETDREAGVAHFLEHLTFRSKDIAKRVEAVGGDINAYTSFDKTVYHLTVPKEHYLVGLAVLQDILFRTVFEDKSFNEEKKVILEEMKRSYDNPQKMLYNLFFQTALPDHPAGRPVIGYEKTITEITKEEVADFYNRFYNPKTAFLVVAGDIEDGIVTKISELFGETKKSSEYGTAHTLKGNRQKNPFAVKVLNVNSCYLMLGLPTPDIYSPFVPAIDVLSFIYGESNTSLLKEHLKEEKQLVNYIYSYQMSMKDLGFFVVQTNFSCGQTEKVIDEMFQVLFKKRFSFGEDSLKKAITSYESNYFFSRERFTDIASDMGSSYLYYQDPEYSKKYIDEIRKIKLADLEMVKKRFFNMEKATVVMVVPPDYEKAANVSLQKLFPKADKKDQIFQQRLKNGVRLIIKDKKNVPTFAFSVLSLAGSRIEDVKTAGLSGFTASCVIRGTKNHSYKELSDKIERIGGAPSGFSTKNLTGIKGKFLSSGFYDAIKILEDILLNFSPPADEIEKVKKLVLSDIRKKPESPTRLLKDLLFSTLYPDSPFGFPLEGTEETVSGVDAKMVKKHFKRLFSPENLVVVFAGDLPDDAGELIARTFEKLEGTSITTSASLKATPRVKEAVIKGAYNQSHIIISFPVPGLKSEERPYLQLFSTILSNQSGRLFTNLRDEKGLAYALGAFLYESPEGSLFNLYIGTSPEKVETAKEGLFEELEKTIRNGITEEEKEKAVNQILIEIIQSLQENMDISNVYANNQLFFNDPLYFKRYEATIKAINTADITDKLKPFLKKENAVTVIIEGKPKP